MPTLGPPLRRLLVRRFPAQNWQQNRPRRYLQNGAQKCVDSAELELNPVARDSAVTHHWDRSKNAKHILSLWKVIHSFQDCTTKSQKLEVGVNSEERDRMMPRGALVRRGRVPPRWRWVGIATEGLGVDIGGELAHLWVMGVGCPRSAVRGCRILDARYGADRPSTLPSILPLPRHAHHSRAAPTVTLPGCSITRKLPYGRTVPLRSGRQYLTRKSTAVPVYGTVPIPKIRGRHSVPRHIATCKWLRPSIAVVRKLSRAQSAAGHRRDLPDGGREIFRQR
ncbi:hypothetical protein C8F01DRAFT_1088790 [Mycena amicta]|nr:hypothetical protein C8F01DRAFT_1088790 [Mycena amicta]